VTDNAIRIPLPGATEGWHAGADYEDYHGWGPADRVLAFPTAAALRAALDDYLHPRWQRLHELSPCVLAPGGADRYEDGWPAVVPDLVRGAVRARHPQAARLLAGRDKEVAASLSESGHYHYVLRGDCGSIWLRLDRLFGEGPRTRLGSALRAAVREQVDDFKRFAAGEVLCPYLGVRVHTDRCDVDHAPPWTFAAIVTGWLRETDEGRGVLGQLEAHAGEDGPWDAAWYGLDDGPGGFGDSPVFLPGAHVRGVGITASFAEYHEAVADLRFASRFGNRRTDPGADGA
jgi:hypothetical protein